MSLISILHSRRKRCAQAVLTVFVLAWLNLTLQQCVLAASAKSDPQQVVFDITGENGVFSTQADAMNDCPDCVMLCGAGCNDEIDCDSPETFMVSASITAKKDIPHEHSVPPLPGIRATLGHIRELPASDIVLSTNPPSSGPPLNVRYCVYLK